MLHKICYNPCPSVVEQPVLLTLEGDANLPDFVDIDNLFNRIVEELVEPFQAPVVGWLFPARNVAPGPATSLHRDPRHRLVGNSEFEYRIWCTMP